MKYLRDFEQFSDDDDEIRENRDNVIDNLLEIKEEDMIDEIGGEYLEKKKYKKTVIWDDGKNRDNVIDKLLESDNYFIRMWDKIKKILK